MLRRFARCFLLVLAAAAYTPAVLAQQVAVEDFSLPNGMQFLLVPRNDEPNVVSAGWVAKWRASTSGRASPASATSSVT